MLLLPLLLPPPPIVLRSDSVDDVSEVSGTDASAGPCLRAFPDGDDTGLPLLLLLLLLLPLLPLLLP
jgi:hypothetical protein